MKALNLTALAHITGSAGFNAEGAEKNFIAYLLAVKALKTLTAKFAKMSQRSQRKTSLSGNQCGTGIARSKTGLTEE